MLKRSNLLVGLFLCSLCFKGIVLTKPIKIVLAGGPQTGKTTTKNRFKELGYQTTDEAATYHIKQELNKGNPHPANNRATFQENIRKTQMALEAELKEESEAFLDRGIIDGIAYYKLDGIDTPEELISLAQDNRYDYVFLFDFVSSLDSFRSNEVSPEDFVTAQKIQQFVIESYKEYGYEPSMVPAMSVDDRVEFILDKVKELKKQNPIKHVITGGPGTGKTTLINELKKMGHKTVVEAATFIITEDLKNSGENPNKHPETFQAKVAIKQIEHESVLDSKDEAFLDRGIVDGIAYSKFYNNPAPKELTDYVENESNKYRTIFMLDPIDSYEENEVRLESKEDAQKLHDAIKLAYEDLGYNVVDVPFLTVAQRVQFILDKIKA